MRPRAHAYFTAHNFFCMDDFFLIVTMRTSSCMRAHEEVFGFEQQEVFGFEQEEFFGFEREEVFGLEPARSQNLARKP